MDKETYTSEKVGSVVNDKFIAVKLQMDSTKDDDEQTRKWYLTARQIQTRYSISGYPTYLFFSPEGKLVHQDEGYKNAEQFILLANIALDPSKQYEALIEKYKNGSRDATTVMQVAKAAKKFGYKPLADSIARAYKIEQLNKLEDNELFTKENITFVAQDFAFLINEDGSKGRFFRYFYQHPNIVDSLAARPGFAIFYVEGIITTEELTNKLFPTKKHLSEKQPVSKNPDWDSCTTAIASKYGAKYANKVVSEFQKGFYRYIGNWSKWTAIMDEKIKNTKLEKGGKNLGSFGDDWTLNDLAWTVLQSANDKKALKKALEWSELAITLKKEGPGLEQYLDTKANLLYKLGKVKKAIKLEEQVVILDKEFAKKDGKETSYFTETYNETIKNMRAGIPTWRLQ
jgi:hypothetical protein